MEDDTFGVPAGWYPDPLGLPQLRWWDAQAWTEHTSEARAPIVIQPATRLAYADEELPSRREQRERERAQAAVEVQENELDLREELELRGDTDEAGDLSAQPLLHATLRELEPPLSDTVDDETPGPRRASFHQNAQARQASAFSDFAEQQKVKREKPEKRTYTVSVWLIATMPLLQLTVAIIFIIIGLGGNLPLMILVVAGPYLVVLGLAAYDRLMLKLSGHEDPASPAWALLFEPGYLLARAIRTVRETGKGYAPLTVFAGALGLLLAAVIALPGLLIAMFPVQFANEAANTVTTSAAALGVELDVVCPTPPLIIGDGFTCVATKPSGDSDSILVSLQRTNGWIGWQVDDWGVWVLTDP